MTGVYLFTGDREWTNRAMVREQMVLISTVGRCRDAGIEVTLHAEAP